VRDEITSLEVKDGKILVRKVVEVPLRVIEGEEIKRLGEWAESFEKVIPTWSGYGVAKTPQGWVAVDLRGKRVLERLDAENLRGLIRSFAIGPSEWGPWCAEIPVKGLNRL